MITPTAFDARRLYARLKAISKIEGFTLKPIQKKVVIASRLRYRRIKRRENLNIKGSSDFATCVGKCCACEVII